MASTADQMEEVLRAKVPEGSMLRVTLDDDKTIVRLGSLWDERHTKWVSGNFFNKDLRRGNLDEPSDSDDVHTEISTTPSDNIFSDDVNDVADISEMFKFDASLSMAFMGGTLKITGHGHYDSSTIDNYENTSFVYAWRRTTATERVKQSVLRDSSYFWEKYKKKDTHPENENDEPMGTHFVSAIVYGGTLSMTSTAEKSFHGYEQTIGGGLEVSYAALASGKADFTMNSQEAKYYEKVTTTIKGDVNIPDLTKKLDVNKPPENEKISEHKSSDTTVSVAAEYSTDAAITQLETQIQKIKSTIVELEDADRKIAMKELDTKEKQEMKDRLIRLKSLKRELKESKDEVFDRLNTLKTYRETVRKQEINYSVNALLPGKITDDKLLPPKTWKEGKPDSAALAALEDEIERLEKEESTKDKSAQDSVSEDNQQNANDQKEQKEKSKKEQELTDEITSLEQKLVNLEAYAVDPKKRQIKQKEIEKKKAQCDKLEEMRDRLLLEGGNKALNDLRKSDLDASEAAFQGGLGDTKDAASVKFREGSWATAAAGLKGARAALDAYDLMAMAPTLLASAIKTEGKKESDSPGGGFYGVPLYYVLQPISSVVDDYAIVATKMDEEVAKATTEEYSRFEGDMEKLGWLSRHRALMMAPTQQEEIKQFHSNFHTYMLGQFKRLGTLLPKLRAGKDDKNGDPSVLGVVTEIRTHPHFSSLAVSKFLSHHRGIAETYDAWLSQGALAVRRVKPLVMNYLKENVPGKLEDGGGNESANAADTSDSGDGSVSDDRLTSEERCEPLLEQDQLDFHKSYLPFRPFFETQVLTGVGAFAYNSCVVVARDVRELKRALDNPRVSHSGRSVLLHSVVRPPFPFQPHSSMKLNEWPDGTKIEEDSDSNDSDALMTLSTSLFARGNRDGGSRETPFIILCDVTDRSPSAHQTVVGNVSRNKSSLTLLDPRRTTGKLVYGENFEPPSAPSRVYVPEIAVPDGVEPYGETSIFIGVEIPFSGSRLGNRFHVQYKADLHGRGEENVYIVCRPKKEEDESKPTAPEDDKPGAVEEGSNGEDGSGGSGVMDGSVDLEGSVTANEDDIVAEGEVAVSASEKSSDAAATSSPVPKTAEATEQSKDQKDVQATEGDRKGGLEGSHPPGDNELDAEENDAFKDEVYFGTLTGLEPNTRYFLRVRATVKGPKQNDVAGHGPWSHEVASNEVAAAVRYEEWLSVATRAMAPTGIKAKPCNAEEGGSRTLQVEFNMDTKQQERYRKASERIRLLRFEIRSNPDVPESQWLKWNFDEALDEWNTGGKHANPFRLRDLCPNKKYDVQVRAVSEEGPGKWSEAVSTYTLPAKPNPPKLVEPKAITGETQWCTAVKVAWNECSDVVRYELRWIKAKLEKEKDCIWDCTTLNPEEVRDLKISIESLESNTRYAVQLRTVNKGGPSKWSNSRYANTCPSQPGNPQFLDKGKEIWVEWNGVDDGSEGVSIYELYFVLPDGKIMPNSTENKINANASLSRIDDSGKRFRYEIKETRGMANLKVAATVRAISNASIDGVAIKGKQSQPGSFDYKASGVLDTELQRLKHELKSELDRLRRRLDTSNFMEMSSEEDKYVLKPGSVSSVAIANQAITSEKIADWNMVQNEFRDIRNLALRKKVFNVPAPVYSVAVVNEGQFLVGLEEGGVALYDAGSSEPRKVFACSHGRWTRVLSLAVMKDGVRVVSGINSKQNNLKLWRLPDDGNENKEWKELTNLEGHTDGIHCVGVIDNDRIVSGSSDKTARIWDLGTTEQKVLQHPSSVYSVSAVDDDHILTGAEQGEIRLWRISTEKEERVFEGHPIGVNSIVVINRDTFATTSSAHSKMVDDTIRIWEIKTGECRRVIKGDKVYGLTILHEDLLASRSDSKVQLWKPSTGEFIREINARNNMNRIVALDDHAILVGGLDHKPRGKSAGWLQLLDKND